MKTKRANATNISQRVKKTVWERDKGRCVVCGNNYNVMPNAHIVPRSKGGLGIETNIVTMCTNFTENKCHYKYDFGTKKERQKIKEKLIEYMKEQYGEWIEEEQIYKKRWK